MSVLIEENREIAKIIKLTAREVYYLELIVDRAIGDLYKQAIDDPAVQWSQLYEGLHALQKQTKRYDWDIVEVEKYRK